MPNQVASNFEGFTLENNKIVFVEGNDDKNVIEALCNVHDIDSIDIFNLRGKDLLKEGFDYIHSMYGNDIVGYCIILDANSDRLSKKDKIINIFDKYNLPIPENEGELARDDQGSLFTSFQLIPTHQENGKLEDMLLHSVQNTPNMRCVEEMFECLASRMDNYTLSDPSKSKAKAFISTKTENVPHVGIAAKKNYWNFDTSAFEPLNDMFVAMDNF